MYKVTITITKYIPNTPGPFSSKLNFFPFQGEKIVYHGEIESKGGKT